MDEKRKRGLGKGARQKIKCVGGGGEGGDCVWGVEVVASSGVELSQDETGQGEKKVPPGNPSRLLPYYKKKKEHGASYEDP